MELRETIDLEVERLGLPGLRTELAALQQELWALGRQGEELQVAISLWDRWMIFSDTPAEAQVKDTRERAAQVERSLAFVRKQLDAAHAQLGELCPPFAVALGLCECLPLAYTGVTVEGWLLKRVAGGGDLRAALTELAGLLRRTYFPSLDFAALRARLAELGIETWLRFVVVPGLTDSPATIGPIADYAASLGNVTRVEVLPFHQLGRSKWADLGLEYELAATPEPSVELTEATREIFRSRGLLTY